PQQRSQPTQNSGGSNGSSTQAQQPQSQQPASQTASNNSQTSQQSNIQGTQSAQQFITVAVSEDETTGQDTVTLQNASQAVHSTYVQYVDGNADPNIYAATNGQMAAYPVYCVSGETSTMYTPATAYYNTGNSTAVTYSQSASVANDVHKMDDSLYQVSSGLSHSSVGLQGQLLTHQGGGTYLIQGSGTMDGDAHTLTHASRASPQTEGVAYLVQGSSVDGDGHHLTHATRVSPQTVQWLLDNYETAEGVSLPRSTLYNHYLRHCAEHKIDPVNAASFGKLIRSVFLGLRTRRLGTRGNSKYHYYGIRVKPSSSLNQMAEDVGTMALRQQPMNQSKRFKATQKSEVHDTGANASTQSQTSSSSSDSTSPQQQHHQQFLGDASSAVPSMGVIELSSSDLPDGVTIDDVHIFSQLYKEHCEAILESILNLQFSMVEILWHQFWRIQPPDQESPDLDLEKRLSKTKLYLLCSTDPVQQFVRKSDYHFYQNLVEILIPDVLRPIPSSLTQAIRNFAKSLEGWLTSSMSSTPDEMVKIKISAVSAFAQTLRRYTSLNHLAQAARAVLQNTLQINQMLADLNRVDFHNVQEQASWVCQCDDGIVQKLEQDFKLTLQQQNSLEQWAAWLEGVVCQVLKVHEGKPDFAKAARQFLLKWSFYSSMVIRDLTLRSAASFGSFHLIRLLYDEYMFYLIEHRVAHATGETPIAVMGDFIGLGHKVWRENSSSKTANSSSTANGNHAPNHMGMTNAHATANSIQKIVLLNSASASSQSFGSSSSGGSTSHGHKRLKTN
uniref:RFX-type winged-helix domain-containing protein n=1 Tax=Strigamia maritima TaxID=126957 RepID=T1JBB3_STRMM